MPSFIRVALLPPERVHDARDRLLEARAPSCAGAVCFGNHRARETHLDDETLVLLSLGQSTNEGIGLDDVRKSWPVLLEEMVAAELGRKVRVESRRLNPDGRDPTEYLRRLVAEAHPDVVLFGVGAYGFAVGRVVNRMSEVFGVRVARVASRVENRTRTYQKTERPGLINRTARKVMTRFIGTAPVQTRAEVEYTIERMYRFLGQQENLAVIGRDISGAGSATLRERNPGYARLSEEFSAMWEVRARELHFYWVPRIEDPPGSYGVDGVHRSEIGHRARAENVKPIVLQALREVLAK